MFQMLSYSGISTKAKAMSGKLIKPAQYEQLIACISVGDALSYLKRLPAYSDIFKDFDEISSHRGSIEATLRISLYQDFNRLYRFANPSQRDFLDLYFIHYEIAFLKICLRSAFSGSDSSGEQRQFRDFFSRRSKLRFDALMESKSIDSYIQALSGTVFHAPLQRIQKSPYHTLFDYEVGLDQFCFSMLWKQKDKILSGKELEIITESYGQQIDLLNLQWIMRAKRYYQMSSAELYAMTIPCFYKLKQKEITAMAETSSYEELVSILSSVYYGKKYRSQVEEVSSIEKTYRLLLNHIYSLAERRNPYTIAPVKAYLYKKEQEIDRITSILEGIRYGIPKRELADYITKSN